MMIDVMETSLEGYVPLRVISFERYGGEKSPYRCNMTMNGFFHNPNNDYSWNKKTGLEYRKIWSNDVEERYGHLPRVFVSSVWEFYEMIGFDYKTKKYKEN